MILTYNGIEIDMTTVNCLDMEPVYSKDGIHLYTKITFKGVAPPDRTPPDRTPPE